MSDSVIAAIARRLAEALAASGYERTPETRMRVAVCGTELVAAVRKEQENGQENQTQTPAHEHQSPRP